MALRRGFPVRNQIRSKRRQVAWGVGPNAQGQISSVTNSVVWTNGVVLLLDVESTIVRIRGDMLLRITAAAAAGDGFSGAVGMGIVNSQAFAAGIVSMPTPVTEADWPGWMYHRFFNIKAPTGTLADGANADAIVQRLEIDSKAMRKIGTEEVFFGAIQFVEVGTSTIVWDADTRILLKLP